MELEQIIEENKNLIRKIARKYYTKNSVFSVEDLEQVGYLSLTKKYKKYDHCRGAMSTFVTFCVQNDIIKFIKKQKLKKLNNECVKEDCYLEKDSINDYLPEDTTLRDVIQMKYSGYTIREISEKIKKPERSVRRLLKKIRENNE